ncbi:MAG: sigma-70 family RNA polymerase sigma factor [Acidobacteria bacterium]|nr:sigma-70 family RNA polymerase sigma factor [Acidobacteriota bacterium]MCW5950570.1 sigma-70 family RNA polymerase sigma factor [Pyrinomonadaceae bacterium]
MLEEAFYIDLDDISKTLRSYSDPDPAVGDDQLVARTLAGDEAAFAEIFESHKRQVARTIGRIFNDPSDVEEYLQQTFTKAYFSLKSYKGGNEGSLAAWLLRIAVNLCYDGLRKKKRRAEALFSDSETEEGGQIEIASSDQPVEKKLATAQLAERVLSSLDERDRIAMTLVYSEQRPLEEVAEIMGISTSNLKSRLFRSRNFIKGRFGHLFR